MSTQWFMRMGDMSRKAVELVQSGEIRIMPERFEKVRDVCVYFMVLFICLLLCLLCCVVFGEGREKEEKVFCCVY